MARFFSILTALVIAFQGPLALAQDNASWKADPALWKVSDADTEVYLLGTFHILTDNVDWRSQKVADAIDRAESFWFEIESDTPEFAETAQRIAQERGVNPEGVVLSGLLGEEDTTTLNAILADLTIPPTALEGMKPWQAFLALESLVAVAEGLTPGTGVDATILREARARGRTVAFFETTEEQLSQFTDLPPETALDLLKTTINAWADQRGELLSLIKAWTDGDIEQVDQLMNDRLRTTSPETYEKFVIDRNNRWSSRIAAMLDQPGTAMVAVGATHFAGDHSIPALLAEAGLNVERIADNAAPIVPSSASSAEPDAEIVEATSVAAASEAAGGVAMPKDALSKLFPDAAPPGEASNTPTIVEDPASVEDLAIVEEDAAAENPSVAEESVTDAATSPDQDAVLSDAIIAEDIVGPEEAILDAEQDVEFSEDNTASESGSDTPDPSDDTVSTDDTELDDIDLIEELLKSVEEE